MTQAGLNRCAPRQLFVALLLCVVVPWTASAQMVLPGATAPAPEGAPVSPGPARPKPRPVNVTRPPPPVLPPSLLAGKTLSLNGGPSQVTFEPRDKAVDVVRLTLTGELISNPRQTCRIDAPNTPIGVTAIGHPDGIERIQLNFPACPIAFEVLDGAVLVDPAQAVCTFAQANCRVNPAGLWGPQSGELGPDKQKSIEHTRAAADAAMRANYKGLVATTKDRPTIMGYAREQAQFSSTREETCRDYVGEGRHGFCAATLTQARATKLRAALGDAVVAKVERKKKRQGRAGGKP